MEKTISLSKELVVFGQGNIDAALKSAEIWVAGMREMAKDLAAGTRAQATDVLATLASGLGAKTYNELLDLQAALARSSVERAFGQAAGLTGASAKLAAETLAPLQARMTAGAGRRAQAA